MSKPVFALALPIGRWHEAFPWAVRSLAMQDEALNLAVMDASGDARVSEALAPIRHLIRVHQCGPDKGQAAAIQAGWDALTGDYFGWLNADDFLYPGALSKVTAAFGEDPEAEIVCGQSMLFDDRLGALGLHPGVRPPSDLIRRSNTVSQPSAFVRAQALSRIGGLSTALDYTMDWDLWTRLWNDGARFHHTEACLSGVVMGAETKTGEFSLARQREILRLVGRYQGPLSAAKALFGHWVANRTSREGEDGWAGRYYEKKLGAELSGDQAQPLAGLPVSGETLWPLLDLSEDAKTQVQIDVSGPVEVRFGDEAWQVLPPTGRLPLPAPVDTRQDLRLRPMGDAVRVKRIALIR